MLLGEVGLTPAKMTIKYALKVRIARLAELWRWK